jgi:ABC-type multidrug transport system fused ATPase/permease subunit
MKLIDLFKQYKKGIAVAITLVIIENVAWIIEPTVFGQVIDAFIEKSARSELSILTPLFIWIGVFLINSGVGAGRRSVDQRIYLNMFTHIATDVARIAKEKGHTVSKTAARAELSREYISFFQYRLPEILEQAIAIGGAIIALMFFDWRIALTCLLIVLPLSFITKLYNNKVILLQKTLHDSREQALDIFSTNDPEKIKQYYAISSKSEQKIANWGAFNFGVMRSFLLVIFLVVLYIAIDIDDFSTGSIYSIVAYLWTFVTSSEYLPELLESWTSLKEISGRLKLENA